MITYAERRQRFNFRVAGIAIREGRVLLHTAPGDDFWTLPGGRAEMLEFTPDTLRREMAEEIGVAAQQGHLVWIVENFFRYAGQECHEVCFYYAMSLPQDAARQDEFLGTEGAMPPHYRWTPLAELHRLHIEPSFLREGLRNLPAQIVHLCLDQRGGAG